VLILKDIDLARGMEIINQAVKLYPGDQGLLYTQGVGYFKQKKYEAALAVLLQSKDSLKSINLEVDKQILEVRNALAASK